jgi:hypothetical protein
MNLISNPRIRDAFKIQRSLLHIAQAQAVYRLSINMVGVFIPFVILKHGGALWMVAGYYLLRSALKLIINFWFVKLIRHYGAHFGLGFGYVFAALQLASVLGFASTSHPIFLIFGAVSLGLADTFGDNSRHMYISQAMEITSRSSSMATMEIMGQTADMIGPLIGAVVGEIFGTNWLLIVALIILGFSIVPLKKMGPMLKFDESTPLHFGFRGAPVKDLFADFCFVADEAVCLLLWPVYLAVILGNYIDIGTVTVIAGLAAIITVWVAGHRGDKGQDKSVLKQGAAGMSLANVLRIAALTPFSIAAVNILYQSSQEYTLNALNSTTYSHMKREGLQYYSAMQFVTDIAYTSVWAILFTVLLISNDVKAFFTTAFILAAVSIWGVILIAPHRKSL